MATTQKKSTTKKTASSAAPRKRTPPPPQPVYHPVARAVGGGACLLLALCVLVTYFGVDALLLRLLALGLKGLFGYGYWLFAPAFAWAGAVLLGNKEKPVAARVTCTLLLPVLLGMLLHLFLCVESYSFRLADMKPLWLSGQLLQSGGVVAGAVAGGCTALLSRVVSAIVFLALLVAALFLALEIKPAEAARKLKEHMTYAYDDEEDEEEPDPAPARPARRESKATKKALFPIDIPLENEPSAVPVMENAAPKPFFRKRDASVRTPAEVLQGETAPVDPPAPAAEAAPPAPAREDKPTKRRKQISPDEVDAATEEVTEAIEKELSEEEGAYQYPPITLLDENHSDNYTEVGAELRSNAARLAATLNSFGVDAQPGEVVHGPSVTRYEFTLDQGVKLSKITNLADDIALALGASGVRIAPVPNKISAVGIEVPNKAVTAVRIRDVVASRAFAEHPSPVAFAVGKDIGGSCIVGNIAKLPHVLIAGTTGSGKSVCTNSLIVSLLYKSTPDEVRFIMVDPKMVELAPYNGIPHLLIPVVTDPKKAAGALQWAVFEMMKRYKIFSEHGVKDLAGFNALAASPSGEAEGLKKMPTVVVVIDELADLMLVAAKEVEESICRVAQMGRAAGMHLVIATQRPSADVITGLMKANIPSRIAFAVASSLESRIILDTTGAEKLVGKGDMLYFPLGDSKPTRVQGCFISPEEIERVVAFVKNSGEVHYDQTVMDKIEEALKKDDKGGTSAASAAPAEAGGEEDELLAAAVEVILETGQASVSMLQRRLKLGYSRAARLVDQMEERGIVGPFEGSKPRQMLITREQWQEMQMKGTAPSSQPQPDLPRPDPYGTISDVFDSHDALD